jgi:flagellin-specific chaperone FliS
MKAHQAYRQQPVALSRIDLILTLYDGALERLAQARALRDERPDEARQLLQRVQLIIGGIAAGMDPTAGDAIANFYRLYEFIVHSVAEGTEDNLRGAQEVLQSLRDGFEAVRDHAMDLERRGEIPPLDVPTLQTLA